MAKLGEIRKAGRICFALAAVVFLIYILQGWVDTDLVPSPHSWPAFSGSAAQFLQEVATMWPSR